jgi:hypothetical protein
VTEKLAKPRKGENRKNYCITDEEISGFCRTCTAGFQNTERHKNAAWKHFLIATTITHFV